MVLIKFGRPKTQKAKGIAQLERGSFRNLLNPTVLVQEGARKDMYAGMYMLRSTPTKDGEVLPISEQIDHAWAWLGAHNREYDAEGAIIPFSVFARPCPMTPRHGFVDSRVVEDKAEAMAVWEAARAADPEAEMLLSAYIEPESSAVWRPGELVVGPSNDGATSGHGSLSIPLVVPSWIDDPKQLEIKPPFVQAAPSKYEYWRDPRAAFNLLCEDGGVDLTKDDPFIESVNNLRNLGRRTSDYAPTHRLNNYVVQLRAGPRLRQAGVDFVTRPMRVAAVVLAEGDLLEWETKAREFIAGTVVYHPGGSLASHYAVHCIINGVPVMMSRRPKVGELLEPTVTGYQPINPQAVAQGIAVASTLGLNGNAPNAVAFGLTVLHNMAAMQGKLGGYWLGAAAVLLHRVGCAGLFGEARHAGDSTNSSIEEVPSELRDMLEDCGDRSTIYERFLNDVQKSRELLSDVSYTFRALDWRGGYGGPAWGACAEATISLDKTIRAVAARANPKSVSKMAEALNTVVNQAHNGGWWFNKFVQSDMMDLAAVGDPTPALMGSHIFFALDRARKSLVGRRSEVRNHRRMWTATKPTSPYIKYEPVLKAQIQVTKAPLYGTQIIWQTGSEESPKFSQNILPSRHLCPMLKEELAEIATKGEDADGHKPRRPLTCLKKNCVVNDVNGECMFHKKEWMRLTVHNNQKIGEAGLVWVPVKYRHIVHHENAEGVSECPLINWTVKLNRAKVRRTPAKRSNG